MESLPINKQEKIIGRLKADDIEVSDGVRPYNSHSALANVGVYLPYSLYSTSGINDLFESNNLASLKKGQDYCF